MEESNRYRKYEPIFGSWHIEDKIGSGAVGQVYAIAKHEFGTTYKAALKAITIPQSNADVKSVLSSGVEEADLEDYYNNMMLDIVSELQYLAKLKGSSHIVSYEDHQVIKHTDGIGWDILIKTEMLKSVADYSIDKKLKEADILRLGIDICKALEYCAENDIIHRDIKPENIFISPGGDYKLGDFGVARVVEETQMTLTRKGTYSYMAPEVFHGQHYGPLADLYSLGLVLYKYLNHERNLFMPPYPAKVNFDDSEKAFIRRMSDHKLPVPASGSAKLKRIVVKACAYNPCDRYQSAEAMRADLEAVYFPKNLKALRRKGIAHDPKVETLELKREPETEPKRSDIVENTGKDAPHTSASPINDDVSAASGTDASDIVKETRVFEQTNPRDEIAPVMKPKHVSPLHGKRKYIFALTAACLIGLAIWTAIPKEVTDITGVESTIELYYDESIHPEYTVEPDWFKDEPIRFESGDPEIFTVSDNGEIVAESIGDADLTMRAKEYVETVHVSVVPKVTGIGNLDTAYRLEEGDTVKLTPTLQPEEFANETITYGVKDESVAKVTKDGTVTAVKAGETKVTVSAGGSSTSASIKVTEKPVVTHTKSSRSSTKSSGGASKKSSKKSTKKSTKKSSGSGGYFESGDDEYF